jgi:hypothetical protein
MMRQEVVGFDFLWEFQASSTHAEVLETGCFYLISRICADRSAKSKINLVY